ncbi:hypothetical protein Y032_0048g1653 [Ancylostoma ceylanicum]|nr:hypothetical protein Y032_0048g1653 [Ancylostoma ceylanicum]
MTLSELVDVLTEEDPESLTKKVHETNSGDQSEASVFVSSAYDYVKVMDPPGYAWNKDHSLGCSPALFIARE